MKRVRLDRFKAQIGLDRGKPVWVEGIWYLVKVLFFLSAWPWPSSLKCGLLRFFGAKVGRGIVIKPRVNIHLPWKIEIGDHCWLGEEIFILNLEPVTLGAHVCLSQRAFLCTGNHDYRSESFCYRNAPIQVEEGVWVGAQAFIGPGVQLGRQAVIQAGSVVLRSVSPNKIFGGNPAQERGDRWA